MFSKITLALAVAAAGLAGSASLPQTASADHGYGYGYSAPQHICSYKTIVTYVYKQIPVKKKVVLYHPCGTKYYVWKTYYKTVKFPVYKKIKTCCHH